MTGLLYTNPFASQAPMMPNCLSVGNLASTVSDIDNNNGPQAGAPFSGSSSDAMTQVGSPMRAPLQTPYAPTSQPGISDVSAGTDISSNSWQQRPSLQGMALQVQHCSEQNFVIARQLRADNRPLTSGTRAVLGLNEMVVIPERLAAEGPFMPTTKLSGFSATQASLLQSHILHDIASDSLVSKHAPPEFCLA